MRISVSFTQCWVWEIVKNVQATDIIYTYFVMILLYIASEPVEYNGIILAAR